MATRDRINIRVDRTDRELFDRAAEARDENLTQFLIESGRERAERLLADRTTFTISQENWQEIVDALDRPARPKLELTELFSRPRPE
jgi:uncharacterized protein (DUF1778 family)